MRRPALALLFLLPAAPLLAQTPSPPAQAQAPAGAALPAVDPSKAVPPTQPRTTAEAAPTPADLLFERSHWHAAEPGSTLVYRYGRFSGLPDVLGPPFEDTIRLKLRPAATDAARTAAVELFSGPRRRAAGPFEDIQSNPAVLLFLEHHLDGIAKALKANPRYLKNAIREGMREEATVTPVTATIAGRDYPAWQVEVKPFLDDPRPDRMRGLQNLTYRFVVSDAVPGALVSAEAKATAPDGANLLEEALAYDPSAG